MKVIKPSVIKDAVMANKVYQEAQTLQELSHANIIKLKNVF